MRDNKYSIIKTISIIFLTWRRYNQKLIKPYGITLKQIYVLRQLIKNEFLYPAQVATMLFADRPTTTTIIKNLVKKEWIYKEKDPDNGKRYKIFLSQKGIDKINSVPEKVHYEDKMDFGLYECFSEQEKEVLSDLLLKFSNHMEKIKK
ncbi:MAG: MarR family transcriptional regulator [bacterium]|nr:MarR family transcriptional regulator [bacterium]